MPVKTDDPVIEDVDGEAASDGGDDTPAEASESESAPTPRRHIRGAVAGVVVAVLVVAALLVTGKLHEPNRFSERDATEDFIRAWERSRTGTFVVESEWKRVKPDGETLTAPNVVAQAPPNRLVQQLGSMSGELDGKTVDCFTPPDAEFSCRDGRPLGRSFGDGVQQELRDLRDHFYKTDPPIYRVHTDEHGCYELVQTRVFPNPTFGRLAQLCFDEATGALRYSERHFENLVETLTAQTIRAPLPNDFDLTPG